MYCLQIPYDTEEERSGCEGWLSGPRAFTGDAAP
jgi:hypothetical protein